MPIGQGNDNHHAVAASGDSCNLCGANQHVVLRREKGFSIVQCLDCGLRYLYPPPMIEETNELYSEHYFSSDDALGRGYADYAEQAANLRATFRDRLRFLPPAGPNNRLLDVGAAAGFFVEQARRAGWNAEGLEPSKWASAYARDYVKVPVREGILTSSTFSENSFDVVTFWEVIEHLPDPRGFLEQVARITKPGGTIYLSTPDSDSIVAKVLGKNWLGWRKVPEHLFFFGRRVLTRMLNETGFDVIDARYVTLTVTWPYALERLGASLGLGRAAFSPLARALNDRSVRVNCYYDLMLTAQLRESVQ
jgi:2-polyprenyl-3-methyl-5-hydroxy-6-metoxy-1,4-benzoquinol methylase